MEKCTYKVLHCNRPEQETNTQVHKLQLVPFSAVLQDAFCFS